MRAEKWKGVLGETRNSVFDWTTGERVISDRDALLRGKRDGDYEVDGPHGMDFHAKEMRGPTWLGGLSPFVIGSFLNPLSNEHRKQAATGGGIKEEHHVGMHDGLTMYYKVEASYVED